jgi:uncharacterized protein (UPF0297 family)
MNKRRKIISKFFKNNIKNDNQLRYYIYTAFYKKGYEQTTQIFGKRMIGSPSITELKQYVSNLVETSLENITITSLSEVKSDVYNKFFQEQ